MKFLNDDALNLKETNRKSDLLTKVSKLFENSSKPAIDDVKSLKEDLEELGLDEYLSFK